MLVVNSGHQHMNKISNSCMIEYSIVIPVYNSASSLQELVYRIGRVFESLNKTYEIIMIDDASLDNSWQVMKSLRDT